MITSCRNISGPRAYVASTSSSLSYFRDIRPSLSIPLSVRVPHTKRQSGKIF